MKTYSKSIGIGVFGGIFLGILILFFSELLQVNPDTIADPIFKIGLCALFFVLLFNFMYIGFYRRKIRYTIQLLEEQKPEKALEEMQKIYDQLNIKRQKHIANVIRLNMTAAYCDMEEYSKAFQTLLEVKEDQLIGSELFVYILNTCACYFYLQRYDEFLDYYLQNQQLLYKYKDHKNYGGNVAVIKIFYLLMSKKREEAESLFIKTKQEWKDPRLLTDYQWIDAYLRQTKK